MADHDAIASQLATLSAPERRSLLARLAKEDRRAMAAEVQQVRPRFGSWLRGIREAAGLSQLGLADALHLSRPALANIEAGRQSVAVEFLIAACGVLSVDPHEAIRACMSSEPLPVRQPARRGRPKRVGEQKGSRNG